MKITIVAAIAKNNVIGRDNDLPWYLAEDLKHFKQVTLGKTVLMGRKTYESIVARIGSPLPERENVVITSNVNYKAADGVRVFHSLLEAFEALKDKDEVMVIGGSKIFEQTIGRADKMIITLIKQDPQGDVLFPEIDPNVWVKLSEEPHDTHSFIEYQRR